MPHFLVHQIAVDGLIRVGDRTPGARRSGALTTAKSDHRPPDAIQVPTYMGELVRFVTYALLMKNGFRVSADDGRLLNPAAVFCADRER